MKKFIAIIAGEPNSISSEIIFKFWKKRKLYNYKSFFVIGNIQLLNLQKKKLKYQIKIKKINNFINLKKINKNELSVYDVKYKQKKPFEKLTSKSNNYIFKCFDIAADLIKKKKNYWFYKLSGRKRNFI